MAIDRPSCNLTGDYSPSAPSGIICRRLHCQTKSTIRKTQRLVRENMRRDASGTPAFQSIRAVNAQTSLQNVLCSNFPWCADWEEELKTLFRGYVKARRQRVLDYDDLLLYWIPSLVIAVL
jgi:hypothetical protein